MRWVDEVVTRRVDAEPSAEPAQATLSLSLAVLPLIVVMIVTAAVGRGGGDMTSCQDAATWTSARRTWTTHATHWVPDIHKCEEGAFNDWKSPAVVQD